MPSRLALSGIRKSFGGVRALDGVDLAVDDTDGIVGLIGPNGAGKTTLFDIICGNQTADSGSITFDGETITNLAPHRRARRGFARSFQECRVVPEATCRENLVFAAQDKRLARELGGVFTPERKPDEAARDLLRTINLERFAEQPAGLLSFGQRRLLEIASLLMGAPRVLLLDEPAAGVNPTLLNTVHDVILETRRTRDLIVIVIEHNMPFVMSLASRIVVMHQGAVLEDGTPDAVRASPAVVEAYLG